MGGNDEEITELVLAAARRKKTGSLIYSGYDIFDLCAYSSFEEVSCLLVHGRLHKVEQLKSFRKKLIKYRYLPKTLRMMMRFSIESIRHRPASRQPVADRPGSGSQSCR